MAIIEDAVWISNDKLQQVHRVDPKSNRIVAKINFAAYPCSGLAFGFGSLWVPLCDGSIGLARIDPVTNKVVATLPFAPADDEGGITVSKNGVWIITSKRGQLSWIDPATNTIKRQIQVPEGSMGQILSGPPFSRLR
jgi:streptogramin lyase